MLPTSSQTAAHTIAHDAWPTRVRCRARTWHVLDRREDGAHTAWRLSRGADQPRLIVSPPDEVVSVPPQARHVSRRAWCHAAHAAIDSALPRWWPADPTALPIDLLPWQSVAAAMMLSGHHRRVLLADEVGMGKTVQAGLLLHAIHARAPDASTLVVVPAGLVSQWASELRGRTRVEPNVLDAVALRAEAARPQRAVDASRAGGCWLVSLDLLRRPDVIALLARTRWTLLVVDEAHHCVTGTARLEAVARVAASSVRVLLLTATPTAAGTTAGNCLRAIGARAGEPAMPVIRRNARRLARPRRRLVVLRVGLGKTHDALCARLDRFVARAQRESGATGMLPALVLRRRASSCPAALVRSLERRLDVLRHAPDTPSSPGLFDDRTQDGLDDQALQVPAWRDGQQERREIEQLLRMAKDMPPAGRKLVALARLIRRLEEPVVVFTAYVDTLRVLRATIDTSAVAIVHGEQPDVLRAEAVAAFTRGNARVLLTTDASAEGLNLHQRCRAVIHAEVPVSTRQLEQRTGRLDRYGQPHRVHAIVMASRSLDDQLGLQRLATRAADDEAWLASTVPRRCRRTELVTRLFAADRRAVAGSCLPDDERRDGTVWCHLKARRWLRLVKRLGLSERARAISISRLRVTGGPDLCNLDQPLCSIGIVGRSTAPIVPSCWPPSLRGFVRRARRLTTTLAAWERDASLAAAAEAAGAGRDLFADADDHSTATVAAAMPRVAGAGGAASLTLEVVAVLARRSTMAAIAVTPRDECAADGDVAP